MLAKRDLEVADREEMLRADIYTLVAELWALRRAAGVAWECPGCRGVRLAKQADGESWPHGGYR